MAHGIPGLREESCTNDRSRAPSSLFLQHIFEFSAVNIGVTLRAVAAPIA